MRGENGPYMLHSWTKATQIYYGSIYPLLITHNIKNCLAAFESWKNQ